MRTKMSGDLERLISILTEAGIDREDARFDMGLIYSYLGDDDEALNEAVRKRATGMPVAYIVGRQAFYKEEYKVSPSVLIPRADTELLVESALQFLGALDLPAGDVSLITPRSSCLTNLRILDLCTGTGCVGISILNSLLQKGINAEVVLTDISDEALAVAKENITLAATDPSLVRTVKLDVLRGEFPEELGMFDVVTANPPYINSDDMKTLDPSVGSFEPSLALAGGNDGLVFYPPICELSQKCLNKGGALIVEHGYDQGEPVSQTLENKGFNNVKVLKDFGNNDRVTFGEK